MNETRVMNLVSEHYPIFHNGGLSNLKGLCIEFKYYADGIHSGFTPPG